MFYSHQEKVKIAKEILAELQASGMTGDFLSRCQKRGITAGHRDTQDELFEFEHYVLADVPGGKRAFKESLVIETWDTLCYDTNNPHRYGWKLDCLLRNLGSYTDIQMANEVYSLIFPHLEQAWDDECKRIIARNEKDGVKTTNDALLGWRQARRADAYAAIAARPMSDADRIREMRNICFLAPYAANQHVIGDVLNIHIGQYGLKPQCSPGLEQPRKQYQYRIGVWAAIMEYLAESIGISLKDHYARSFIPGSGCIRDLAGGTALPSEEIVFANDFADWSIIGAQVPFFYRQYVQTAVSLSLIG